MRLFAYSRVYVPDIAAANGSVREHEFGKKREHDSIECGRE
jgi:hypothetical protein